MLPEGMGSPEPPPWFLIFLPRHFSNSWGQELPEFHRGLHHTLPGFDWRGTRMRFWSTDDDCFTWVLRRRNQFIPFEDREVANKMETSSVIRWFQECGIRATSIHGHILVRNSDWTMDFFYHFFWEDPVWIIENYLFCCSPISLRHVTPYLTWYPLAGTTPMKCRPFSQMGIEAFLPKPLKMEFCWNKFGKTQLFEVPLCQIIDHNFYGFHNFSDSAIGDFLKLWRGMERDHARISNFSGRGRMLEFELLDHFASWKLQRAWSLAIFGNSRRVLKVKGLISRLETHKIESERANSMFVNTVWVTSIYGHCFWRQASIASIAKAFLNWIKVKLLSKSMPIWPCCLIPTCVQQELWQSPVEHLNIN